MKSSEGSQGIDTLLAPLGLRERGKSIRRRRILDAARIVFREKGYDAATTREIAQRAEVGTGTLFQYVRDKGDLLMLVFYEDLEAITERAYATLPADAAFIDQLMHMFAPRYDHWGADVALSRYAVRETFDLLLDHDDRLESHKQFSARRPLLYQKVVNIVEMAQQRGTITDGVPAAQLARLCIHVYISESREWVQLDAPVLEDGLALLRQMLEIATLGVVR